MTETTEQHGGAVNRTIKVENPLDKLSDRREWAEEQLESARVDGVTVDVAYFEAYQRLLGMYAETLETGGLPEEDVVGAHHEAREFWYEADEETEETVEYAARADVTKHILETFFGHGPTDLGEVAMSSVYDDGTIEFVGEEGDKVRMTVRDEDDAMAKADLFLRQAGRSIDELRDRHEVIE